MFNSKSLTLFGHIFTQHISATHTLDLRNLGHPQAIKLTNSVMWFSFLASSCSHSEPHTCLSRILGALPPCLLNWIWCFILSRTWHISGYSISLESEVPSLLTSPHSVLSESLLRTFNLSASQQLSSVSFKGTNGRTGNVSNHSLRINCRPVLGPWPLSTMMSVSREFIHAAK